MRLGLRFVFLAAGLAAAPFFSLMLHEALDWAPGIGKFREQRALGFRIVQDGMHLTFGAVLGNGYGVPRDQQHFI
ncbi:hypothetical protein NDU88_002588 [Pleurodeles waltl]|uniref:Uncharacterized protein n=1 Tax=Pleurodeles waltl TaxID=8319 RepID=A0AAV7T3C3_PLEWA|nr:hypothetical protein NDU88_002588 [Pleurodeles waltl]